MSQTELVGWLLLHRLVKGNSPLMMGLIEHFGDATAVFKASRTQLTSLLPNHTPLVDAILDGADPQQAAAELAWLAQEHAHVLTWSMPDYPPLLREIPDPPPLLFVRGDKTLLAKPQIAVVGSRNPTGGGCENARAFASVLAQSGWVITSGLALGIDACAHRAALEVGGFTVALAATGLDRVYPAQHRELAHEITAQGALVSEFSLGSPPRREHFPRRNRLISGLSLGVLVVEAALKSGSLITARLAAEQGREVFAIPGSIHSPLARGSHALIRQGAKLVETAEDIIEELRPWASMQTVSVPRNETLPRESDLDTPSAELLTQLGYDPVDVDTLVERSGLTADAISSMLLQMELRGLVEACPGGKYQRVS